MRHHQFVDTLASWIIQQRHAAVADTDTYLQALNARLNRSNLPRYVIRNGIVTTRPRWLNLCSAF